MIVKNILVGEDIRHELGNKLSLMGIFGGSLNADIPKEAPKEAEVRIPFAFLITIENTDPANDPKDFKVNINILVGANKLASMAAQIESGGKDRVMHLPVPKLEIGFKETTKVSVQVEIIKNGNKVSDSTAVLDININRK